MAWYAKHRQFDGETALFYLAWYGAGRSVIESLRTDSLMLGGLRVSQMLAVVLFCTAAVGIIYGRKKHAGMKANQKKEHDTDNKGEEVKDEAD